MVVLVEVLLAIVAGPALMFINCIIVITLLILILMKVSSIEDRLYKRLQTEADKKLEQQLISQKEEAKGSVDSKDLPEDKDIIEVLREDQ